MRAGDRATEFKSRCRQLGIQGVTLHSYRYAWAERAKVAGMPERFAQEALGHNSKAVHKAYAKKSVDKNSVIAGLRRTGIASSESNYPDMGGQQHTEKSDFACPGAGHPLSRKLQLPFSHT